MWYVLASVTVLIIWGCVFFGTMCRLSRKKIMKCIISNLGLLYIAIGLSKLIDMLIH